MAQHFLLARDRSLVVSAPTEEVSVPAPFTTLMPAFDAAERSVMEALALGLVAQGCEGFCCVGPEAELLHDGLDSIVEDAGALHVLTTGYTDEAEAIEYLLFSGGGTHSMIAMIGSHSELSARLIHQVLSLK